MEENNDQDQERSLEEEKAEEVNWNTCDHNVNPETDQEEDRLMDIEELK